MPTVKWTSSAWVFHEAAGWRESLLRHSRRRIRWRTIFWGLGLQICFAFLVLRFSFGQRAMEWAGNVVTGMLSATFAGTQVLFGELGLPPCESARQTGCILGWNTSQTGRKAR